PGQRHVDRVHLGWAAGRQPAAARRGEDQRPRPLADEGEPPRFDAAVPDVETEPSQPVRHGAKTADEPELGDAEQLLGSERSRPPGLPDPRVRDQLDDVARGILEVAGERLPEGEVEHDLVAVRIGEELDALRGPVTGGRETVAGHQQGEVVERVSARTELELRLADSEADASGRAVERLEAERDRVQVA